MIFPYLGGPLPALGEGSKSKSDFSFAGTWGKTCSCPRAKRLYLWTALNFVDLASERKKPDISKVSAAPTAVTQKGVCLSDGEPRIPVNPVTKPSSEERR